MPPLEQSLSSSHHSVGSSGQRIFASLRHNLTLSPSRIAKPIYNNNTIINTGNCSSNSNNNTSTTTNVDVELRTAKDACVGAMMALLHYLSQQNISTRNCVHELQQTISKFEQNQYDLILKGIIQQYVSKLSAQIQSDEFEIIHMLIIGCWQAQHRLAQVQYQRAYRYYHDLRFNNDLGIASSTTSSTTTMNSINRDRNLEKALHHQIRMAEYTCTCQKEMILCNRTYEHHQQQQGKEGQQLR
jgi:hypothetical protein